MTIKERDFLVVLWPKYIKIIHTYWTIQFIIDTQADKFVKCQIIIN
jgi:hypothetical protein